VSALYNGSDVKSICDILGEKAKLYRIASAPFPIEGFLPALNICNYLALIKPSAISFAFDGSNPVLVTSISCMFLKSDTTLPIVYASFNDITLLTIFKTLSSGRHLRHY
jgi:hypothetical protein